MRIFSDKKLKKQFLKLTLIFSLQELVNVLIGTINTIMLGPTLTTLSQEMREDVTSGVGFAFQIFLMLNIIMGALIFTSNLFYSQHYGRGDIDQVTKDFYFCQKIAFIIGLIFFILAVSIPQQLIGIFAQGDKGTIEVGSEYLRIFGISFLFMPFSLMNYSLMKNTRLELQASITAATTLGIVIVFNSILLYGVKTGPIGAAGSIVIARFIEFIVTSLIIKFKCVVKPKLKGFINPDFSRIQTSSKVMAPIFIGKLFYGLGVLGGVIIIGLFNSKELNTANQLMLLGQNLVNCFTTGIAVSTGVVIGRQLGANRMSKAKETGHDIIKFSALFGLILIAVFFLFIPFNYYTNKSTNEGDVFYYMVILFLIQATMYIPRVYNNTIVNGMLFAGGDTIYPCFMDALTYWLIIIPFSILSLNLNWSPIVPVILVQLEEGIKSPFFYYRYRKFKWIKNLTKKKGFVFN